MEETLKKLKEIKKEMLAEIALIKADTDEEREEIEKEIKMKYVQKIVDENI